MARVETGQHINIADEASKETALIHIDDFPEYVFREYFGRDPEDENTRSQVVQIHFPNGDLVLGFYPQGATFEEVMRYYA